MLYTLLVADMPAANKKKVIHDEYSIPMEKAVDDEVEYVCNKSNSRRFQHRLLFSYIHKNPLPHFCGRG